MCRSASRRSSTWPTGSPKLRLDVDDRLAELTRVRGRLFSSDRLHSQDFVVLDRLQTLLEEEAAEGSRGLYRL